MYEYTVTFDMEGNSRDLVLHSNDEYNAIAAAAVKASVELMLTAVLRGDNPLVIIEGLAELFENGEITIEIN